MPRKNIHTVSHFTLLSQHNTHPRPQSAGAEKMCETGQRNAGLQERTGAEMGIKDATGETRTVLRFPE